MTATSTTPDTAAPDLVRYPLDALVSFHYYRKDTAMEQVVGTRRLALIGDSGAFSAFTQGTPIVMAEYLAWCRQWSPYLAWTAVLDVIGDPAATLRNWREMRDRHQLATVPTLHVGTDPAWIDNYTAEGCDFIALGGMVGRALQSLPWMVDVFRYARDHHPQVRFHLWGTTTRKVLDNLPAYSADSSGILGAAYRFATLRLFDPRTARHVNVQLRAHDVFKHGALLRREYGVDPQDIIRSTPENRHLLIQIAARGTQQYADWLTARHRVSPPTWGLRTPPHLEAPPPPEGSRVHVVSAHGGELESAATGQALPEWGKHPNMGPRSGTRIHAAGAQPGRALDELQLAAGTRVHLVSAGGVTAGRDDLTAAVAPGPRVHVVDTAVTTLVSATTGQRPATWGTRVHLVDGAVGNLVSAAGDTPTEQEGQQ